MSFSVQPLGGWKMLETAQCSLELQQNGIAHDEYKADSSFILQRMEPKSALHIVISSASGTPVTVNGFKIVSNSKFVEVYDGEKYISTLQGVVEDVSDMLKFTVTMPTSRTAFAMKIKMLSLKGNANELTVHDFSVSLSGANRTNVSDAVSFTATPLSPAPLPPTPFNNASPMNPMNPAALAGAEMQMQIGLFMTKVETMIDTKLSPVLARVDRLEQMIGVLIEMQAKNQASNLS